MDGAICGFQLGDLEDPAKKGTLEEKFEGNEKALMQISQWRVSGPGKSQCKGPGAETQQSISWRGQCDGARVRGRVGMKIEK